MFGAAIFFLANRLGNRFYLCRFIFCKFSLGKKVVVLKPLSNKKLFAQSLTVSRTNQFSGSST